MEKLGRWIHRRGLALAVGLGGRVGILCALVLCELVLCAAPLPAEEPKGKFEVHDLSLWVLEPGSQQANLRTAYASALPATAASARTPSADSSEAARPPGHRLGPINMITFYGVPATNLDVDVRTKAGTFLSHWPAGESLPNRLRWSGSPALDLVEKIEDETELAFVDSDHWIRKARGGQALFVRRGARSERFLAYDVELNLPAPVRLEGGPDTYKVINTAGATLYDVLISRGTPTGRRVAWLDVLPASTGAPAAQPAKPSKSPADLFDDAKPPSTDAKPPSAPPQPAEKAEEKKEDKPAESKDEAAAEKDAEKAKRRAEVERVLAKQLGRRSKPGATPPASPPTATPPAAGVEVTLSEPLAAGAAENVAQTTIALTERLSRAGLSSSEIELFVENYRSLFFEGDAVVVACRLGAGAIDEKLPLSVFPEPAKTVRVAMVLLRNADPQLGSEVDLLVTQLGDPHFAAREAAQKRLLELGPLAFATLNQALNNADLEIVIRAERILLHQNQTPNAQAKPAARGVGGTGGAGASGSGGGAGVIIRKK
jgi:hypothetical protein